MVNDLKSNKEKFSYSMEFNWNITKNVFQISDIPLTKENDDDDDIEKLIKLFSKDVFEDIIKHELDKEIRLTEIIDIGIFKIYSKITGVKKLINNEYVFEGSFYVEDIILRNITKEVVKHESLKELLIYDNVTGFKNKEELIELINEDLSFKKVGEKSAFILIDLDDFKYINESFGYGAGDLVLKKIGVRLAKVLFCSDYICRYNGDEFIVYLQYIKSEKSLKKVLDKIMKVFYKPITFEKKDIYISCSIGVAIAPEDGGDFYSLLRNADGAVSTAKGNGKGNYVLFDNSITKEFNRSYDIQRCLRKAIEKNEIYVMFQPKVFASNATVNGFEALLRWESKELGNISPVELIPIAEKTRMILPISTFVLREVFKKIRELIDLGNENFKVAVNLSELQLRHSTILRDLKNFKEAYNVDLKYIEIEITESMLMKSFERNIKILQEIKDLGATIALDDFGTGYSSLNYLTKLPIDVLKIDRSFVVDLIGNSKSRCIVENIINLSHQLGIDVVAEGVEDENQVDYLKSILCDVIQGYYFSKPRMFEEIVSMVGKEIK